MGHRKISTTLRYTQLVEIGDDSFTVKIASNIEEFTALLEQGFEYVSDYGEAKVLRKRKKLGSKENFLYLIFKMIKLWVKR